MNYNEIIDVITSDNVSKNSYKQEESKPDEDDPYYLSDKAELTIAGLKTLRDESSSNNTALAIAYTAYTNERTKILPMFDGVEGLRRLLRTCKSTPSICIRCTIDRLKLTQCVFYSNVSTKII